MGFIDDFKEWSTLKKVASILVVCCIGIIIVAMIGGGLSPDQNTSVNTNSNSSESNSSNQVYTDGTYKVGSDLPAGEYKFTQTSSYGGYVERSSDSSMELESIISNEATTKKDETVYVTVEDGEYLKINGGELVPA